MQVTFQETMHLNDKLSYVDIWQLSVVERFMVTKNLVLSTEEEN